MAQESLKNVLVIGGSFVGCRAAAELALTLPSSHRVILVEPHSHFQHLFTFPRFAVVEGFAHKAFIPYDGFFKAEGVAPEKARVVRARVQLLLKSHVVLDREVNGSNSLDYEYAVIATGTILPPPGTMKDEGKVEGIVYFREHQQRIKKAQRIAILGGGAVGVQMATDIKELFPAKSVTLVHSRLHLLNRFDSKLHDIAAKRFEELGIELILGDRAVIPHEGFPLHGKEFEIELKSGKKIPSDFAIISIGQTPQSSLLSTFSPQSINSRGFIDVKPTLQVVDDNIPNIFAVGDIAETGANKAARPAMEQARLASRNILRLIQGRPAELENYTFSAPAIHLTLGIKRNVIFSNPEHEGEEPWIKEKEDGELDMGVERRWTAMGVPVHDFYA